MRAHLLVAAAWMSVSVVAACSAASTSPPASPGATTTLARFVVQPGLPEAVVVPGEPSQAERAAPATLGAGGRFFTVLVDVPASWTNPPGLGVLCRWSVEEGYGDCADLSSSGTGAESIQLRGTTTPGRAVEVWLSGETAPAFYRRLYAGAAPSGGDLHLGLAGGYASLTDVVNGQVAVPGGGHEKSPPLMVI